MHVEGCMTSTKNSGAGPIEGVGTWRKYAKKKIRGVMDPLMGRGMARARYAGAGPGACGREYREEKEWWRTQMGWLGGHCGPRSVSIGFDGGVHGSCRCRKRSGCLA